MAPHPRPSSSDTTARAAASSAVCISHKEDVDGICSAALIKAAFANDNDDGGDDKNTTTLSTILVDYANLVPKLEEVVAAATVATGHGENNNMMLFVCDLGLSKKNERRFVELLKQAVSAGAEVTYIDHHDMGKEIVQALKRVGVTLLHTIDECTSVQVYSKYKKKLPDHAALFAAMGALTDYMETRPIASGIVARFDRQFLMLEATALSYMISANQHNDEFLVKAVDTLAKMKYPHDIKGGFEIAEKYAKKVASAVEAVQGSITKMKNLAHAPSTVELSSSTVVNFVLGSSSRPVAVVYKLKSDIDSYVVSIRGSTECKVHLGRLVNEIASELGGSGGGHDRASGAVIPKDKLDEFLRALDSGAA